MNNMHRPSPQEANGLMGRFTYIQTHIPKPARDIATKATQRRGSEERDRSFLTQEFKEGFVGMTFKPR